MYLLACLKAATAGSSTANAQLHSKDNRSTHPNLFRANVSRNITERLLHPDPLRMHVLVASFKHGVPH